MRQSDSPVAGNLAPFAKCHEWLAPEVLEARANSVRDEDEGRFRFLALKLSQCSQFVAAVDALPASRS
jgi:hypothetical protein